MILRASQCPLVPTLSLPWSTLTTDECQPPKSLPTLIPSEGRSCLWREGPAGNRVWRREGCFSVRAQPVPGRWWAHPLPTFLPHSIHVPPPQPWFPGSRLQGDPAARPPAAAPSPYKPWPQSTLPPILPACGDSLLAPALPYPPSVRNRCRQTVRTTRGSSDSAGPLLLPLPQPLQRSSPSPPHVLSFPLLSVSSFPLCQSASFLLMKTLTKWEWGGKEDQPARDPHLLVTSTHQGRSTATHLSSSLTLSVSIKWVESYRNEGSASPSVQLSSKSCQAHLPGATRSPGGSHRALCR